MYGFFKSQLKKWNFGQNRTNFITNLVFLTKKKAFSVFKQNLIRKYNHITSLNISTGCPEKNRGLSDESCFTTDTAVRREISRRHLETQKHLVSIDFSYSGFSSYEHLIENLLNAVFFIFKTVLELKDFMPILCCQYLILCQYLST